MTNIHFPNVLAATSDEDIVDRSSMDSISNPSYIPNQPYNSNGLLKVSNTVLPPPEFHYDDGRIRITLRPFVSASHDYGNSEFLHKLSAIPPPFSSTKNYGEWSYQNRHEAQLILPFLYLGPVSAAKDLAYLHREGITMAVSVRSSVLAQRYPKLYDPKRMPSCAGLVAATLDVDSPFEVISQLKPMIKMMNDHLEEKTNFTSLNTGETVGGKILVFCETGNERSAILVTAYIMLLYGLSWEDGTNFVHTRRFCTNLGMEMHDMLLTWEGIVFAERDVGATINRVSNDTQQILSAFQTTSGSNKFLKRNIDEVSVTDEVMLDSEMVESNVSRSGMAPFKDASKD